MCKILIDIYKTKDINSGLGQFSYNYAEKICNNVPKKYHIDFLASKTFSFQNKQNINFKKTNFQNRYLPFLNQTYDIWHSLHQFPSHLPNKKTKLLLTIHDLNFLFEKNKSKSARYLKKLQKNIDKAMAVTVISDYTKDLLLENVKLSDKPLYKIYNGVRLDTFENQLKPDFVKTDKFFFTLGIISAKKNFHSLLPLMRHFKGHQLIIAGKKNTSYARQIEKQIDQLGLKDRVILSGSVNASQKYWLYSNCRALLFPSVAEGFGLPVIEAMLLGKPVFLSKKTSLPEIGGPFAFYWENFDPENMAEVVKEKLAHFDNNQSQLSSQIREYAQKFSWKNCIQDYLEVYEEILKF